MLGFVSSDMKLFVVWAHKCTSAYSCAFKMHHTCQRTRQKGSCPSISCTLFRLPKVAPHPCHHVEMLINNPPQVAQRSTCGRPRERNVLTPFSTLHLVLFMLRSLIRSQPQPQPRQAVPCPNPSCACVHKVGMP